MSQTCIQQHKSNLCFVLGFFMLGINADLLFMACLKPSRDHLQTMEKYSAAFTWGSTVMTFFATFAAITRATGCPLYHWDDKKMPLTRVQFESTMARSAAFFLGLCLSSLANSKLIEADPKPLFIISLLLSACSATLSMLGLGLQNRNQIHHKKQNSVLIHQNRERNPRL